MSNAERNAEIIRLRADGIGPREIARQLRVSPQVVAGVLYRAGKTAPSKGRGNGPTPSVVEYAKSLLGRGFTHSEIAKHFGVDRTTIYHWVKPRSGQVA